MGFIFSFNVRNVHTDFSLVQFRFFLVFIVIVKVLYQGKQEPT